MFTLDWSRIAGKKLSRYCIMRFVLIFSKSKVSVSITSLRLRLLTLTLTLNTYT